MAEKPRGSFGGMGKNNSFRPASASRPASAGRGENSGRGDHRGGRGDHRGGRGDHRGGKGDHRGGRGAHRGGGGARGARPKYEQFGPLQPPENVEMMPSLGDLSPEMLQEVTARLEEKLAGYLQFLDEHGYVIIPGEVVGIQQELVEAAHRQLLEAVEKRPEEHMSLGFFNSFADVPAQLQLQTHDGVFLLFSKLFQALGYSSGVLNLCDRSNISPPGTKGVLVHVDTNPWAPTSDYKTVDELNAAIRAANHHQGLEQKRYLPWAFDRPLQALLALTNCPGGPRSGGICFCDNAQKECFKKFREYPPFGRLTYTELTRILPDADSPFFPNKAMQEEVRQYINDVVYPRLIWPRYSAGDILLWNRETPHGGPLGNDGNTQVRLYFGMLPEHDINRYYLRHFQVPALRGEGRDRSHLHIGRFSAFGALGKDKLMRYGFTEAEVLEELLPKQQRDVAEKKDE